MLALFHALAFWEAAAVEFPSLAVSNGVPDDRAARCAWAPAIPFSANLPSGAVLSVPSGWLTLSGSKVVTECTLRDYRRRAEEFLACVRILGRTDSEFDHLLACFLDKLFSVSLT